MAEGDYWVCCRIYTSKSLSEYAIIRLCTTIIQHTREPKSHMAPQKHVLPGSQNLNFRLGIQTKFNFKTDQTWIYVQLDCEIIYMYM